MPSSILRVVADENIPLVREAFGALGVVRLMPGRQITPQAVREADVLLVRSVTRVDTALIDGSPLSFVGSATIGTDHVDRDALHARGIAFAHAPGSNAESVVEYVLAALLHVAAARGDTVRGKSVGVVGCGAIGARLAARLTAFGARVIKNDPPLAERATQAGLPHDFVALPDALAEADVVTLHVPLTYAEPYATHHLFDQTVLHRLKPGAWLLNTARGAVVSTAAVKATLQAGRLGAVILDVWEHEPMPDPDLLHRVALATPHIAGYSYDGKVEGTRMLYHALAAHLGRSPVWDAAAFASGPDDRLALTPPDAMRSETAWLDALTRQMYDVSADDARLRRLLTRPRDEHAALFSDLRKHYPRRRTFRLHTLARSAVPEACLGAVEEGLRVRLVG